MGPLFAAACGLSLLGQVLSLAIIVSSEGRPKGLESRVFLVRTRVAPAPGPTLTVSRRFPRVRPAWC